MLVHDFLQFHAREQPGAVCVALDERELTYELMLVHSNQLANALIASGLVQGDRFAIISRNSIEMVIAYMAGSIAGLVPVPVNWRLAPPEWRYILDDAGVKLLLSEAEFCVAIDSIMNQLDAVRDFVSIGTPAPAAIHWTDFEAYCAGHSTVGPELEIDDGDVFYQMYTSGTTGRPKGAMLTHYAVTSNCMQTTPYFGNVMCSGKRALVVMPMFHAGAASFMIGSLVAGATMVLHREFSPQRVADAMSLGRINVVNLVPAMIQALLQHVPDLNGRDFSHLQVIIYGASSIAEDTLRRAMDVFGCDFYQGFGQTESTASIVFLTAQDHRKALSCQPGLLLSAGRAIPGTRVRIVDGEDREVACGNSGEIVMQGPQKMKAYWNMPDATRDALRGGWLHTGDIGWMDEEGYVYVQDRLQDMIISGGENVYPREVENVLFEHPSVDDVAVIGVPDQTYGEAVMAVVVLNDGGSLETVDMIDFCRSKIGGYKIPRLLKIVSILPRNPSGKVLKKELRDLVRAPGV